MRNLASMMFFLLLTLILAVWANATILTGTVWFVPDEEEAPCVDMRLYTASSCDPQYLLDVTATDSCGGYTLDGIAGPCWVYVKVDFDSDRYCAKGGWSGTCPDKLIPCEPVWIPDQPVVYKDWDLGLDDCDNVGCVR